MAMIAPSLLAWDFAGLGESLEAIKAAGARLVHIDASDGHFAGEITVGPPVIRRLRKVTDRVLEVHLLVERPERYVAEFLAAGADRLAVHAESTTNLHAAIETIHARGGKAGVAIQPSTPVEAVAEVAADLDFLTLLTADSGPNGERFIPAMLEKVRRASRLGAEGGRRMEIEVEGGIGIEHVEKLAHAGADILVAGSAIMNNENPKARLSEMIRLAAAANQTMTV
jgi:ribulose-phosphate 3-epimerase